VRGIRCHHQHPSNDPALPKILIGDFTMIAITKTKAAFDVAKAHIDAATLETIALFLATGLLISAFLVLYGPDVRGIELYGMVP
jgi:hypothetical protein